ncbi:hypothetical protein VTI74DRAFT_7280 [Chaetomium olivicolor]
MREVPARTLAEELKLPVHIRDTFTGWDMPKPDGDAINLIIAVSFGLFVPPRLINASKYGGLNVHPSLLPDLRGPAPMHHALLAGYSHTGVSIQTLSPQAFDAGHILLQSALPGIPIPESCTLQQLHDLLAPLGAEMLVETLRKGLHVPPYPAAVTAAVAVAVPDRDQQGPAAAAAAQTGLRHAPKITPHDRQVLWTEFSASDAARRARVLGPLWTHVREDREEREKRVILEEVSVSDSVRGQGKGGEITWVQKPKEKAGKAATVKLRFCVDVDAGKDGVVVCMSDGSWLRVGKIKVEGSTSKPARSVLESLKAK